MEANGQSFIWIDAFRFYDEANKSGGMEIVRVPEGATVEDACAQAKEMVDSGKYYRTMVYVNGVKLVAEYSESNGKEST